MLARKKISKKKIIIYSLIILAMLLGNLFIYYRNSQPSRLSTDEASSILDLAGQQEISYYEQRAVYNQSVLEHNLFSALKKIGDWPVVPSGVGKADPFAPVFQGE